MSRRPTPFARCLKIADNTAKYQIQTLISARDTLERIAQANADNTVVLIEVIDACRKLNRVINGTHDPKTYAQAFHISENTELFSCEEARDAASVLKTIDPEDSRYIDARRARTRLTKYIKNAT